MYIFGQPVELTHFDSGVQISGEGPLRPILTEDLTADGAVEAWVDAYRQQYAEQEAMTANAVTEPAEDLG